MQCFAFVVLISLVTVVAATQQCWGSESTLDATCREQKWSTGATEESSCSGMANKILLCDFEVFGIVQGVFFRKYTQKQANSLGVRGWCMNTSGGTVKGQIEGEEKPFNEMKYWLQTKGSPSSRIDKTVFNMPTESTSYSFKDFSIRR